MRCRLAVALLVLASRAAAIDVTTCGQVVPANEVGVLQVDLDCSGGPRTCSYTGAPCVTDAECDVGGVGLCVSQAVVLRKRATLELNGHSVVADGSSGFGIWCSLPDANGECTIRGPGEVSGGAIAIAARKLTIADVFVHDSDQGIVALWLKATNVTADSNGLFGFYAGRLDATNLSASNNTGLGFFTQRTRANGLTAVDNGEQGIISYKTFRAVDVVVTGNGGAGLYSFGSFRVTGLTAQSNGDAGIYSEGSGVLVDSDVSGNLYEGWSLDLITAKRPRLINTTCGVSAQLGEDDEPGATWGICSGD